MNLYFIIKFALTYGARIFEEFDEAEIVASGQIAFITAQTRRIDVGDVHTRLPNALARRSEYTSECTPRYLRQVFRFYVQSSAARRLVVQDLFRSRIDHYQATFHIVLLVDIV